MASSSKVPDSAPQASIIAHRVIVQVHISHSSISLNPPAAFLGPLIAQNNFPENLHGSFPCKCPDEAVWLHYLLSPFMHLRRLIGFLGSPLLLGFMPTLIGLIEFKPKNVSCGKLLEFLSLFSSPSIFNRRIFFWNQTTKNFHFPYGMMGPTFFDV